MHSRGAVSAGAVPAGAAFAVPVVFASPAPSGVSVAALPGATPNSYDNRGKKKRPASTPLPTPSSANDFELDLASLDKQAEKRAARRQEERDQIRKEAEAERAERREHERQLQASQAATAAQMAEFISVQQAMNERLAAEQAAQAERADTTNRKLLAFLRNFMSR